MNSLPYPITDSIQRTIFHELNVKTVYFEMKIKISNEISVDTLKLIHKHKHKLYWKALKESIERITQGITP